MSIISTPIADAAQRLAALNPRESFIIQAPAGSGKTELLTQRLLVLLATADEPEEVVAMTFTRKAAAEMRHRVYLAICAADGPEPAEAHARQTWALARAVLQRSRERDWHLQDSPQRLRVLTIDSLCAQITQQSPLTAGFGGRVEVVDAAEPLYREAARAVLETLDSGGERAGAVRRVLQHFDNRTDVLDAQLVALLGRRDQWLRLVTQDQRAERPREALEATLDWAVRDVLEQLSQAVPDDLKAQWVASAAWCAINLSPDDPAHPLQLLRSDGWPEARPDAMLQWQWLANLVLTGNGGWRKSLDKNIGFPAGTKGETGLRKDAHRTLIEQLANVSGLAAQLQAVRVLPLPRYGDAQWEVLEALLDTLLLAAAHLRLVFAERGAVDFSEIAAQAIVALGGVSDPSELALRMDYQVRHLLIDEFQDTSEAQWRLLLQLTAGWAGDPERTLFVVGDPMQSIYRFREADVGLFLRAQRDGIGELQLTPLTLSCNFRSQAGIVDWVNRSFSQVFPPQADLNRSAVPYSPAVATRAAGAGPAVAVHAQIDATAADEAQEVVAIVREHRRLQPGGHIAVLVRSRGHLEQIAPALRAAGVGYRAVDIEALSHRPIIADLRALTRALLQPMERSAWLAVLRAPWCGLKLADLHELCVDLSSHQSLLGALRDPQRLQRLSADARQRLGVVLTVIERACAVQGREPLRRWVEAVWLALGGPACVDQPTALDDAATFFRCLQTIAPGTMLDDLDQLDLALAKLKATPEQGDDSLVSLMTIHKSKGLEFDVVIVPALGRGTRSDHRPPIAWAHLSDVHGEDRLLMAPVQARGDEVDPCFEFVRSMEQDKQTFEDGRLLYVAATRARQHLHLFASVCSSTKSDQAHQPPPSRSLLARLWPAVAQEFAVLVPPMAPSSAAARTEQPLEAPPLRRLQDWQRPEAARGLPPPAPIRTQANEALRFDWSGEAARCIGVVYHRWVESIAQSGIAQWDAARCTQMTAAIAEDLMREGVPEARCSAAVERVVLALQHTVSDARGRWVLDPAHDDATSELALSVMVDGHPRRYVIDRTFVDAEGTRWIVDFKTSTHEGADLPGFIAQEQQRYTAQLASYCEIMRHLDPRPVRAALYLPLIDDPELRWVPMPGLSA